MIDDNFTATVLGYPRIGPRRELKRAIEDYWQGVVDREDLDAVAAGLRRHQWFTLAAQGLDSIPTNTFSYYDQMLDTAVMLGALPTRVEGIDDPLERYFAAARGTHAVAPLEMTKWFNTNYHHLVPEISPDTTFRLQPEQLIDDLDQALAQSIPTRPVLIGPLTFLALSKPVDGACDPLDRVDELVPLYGELLTLLADRGASWVQIDEPVLVTETGQGLGDTAHRVYRQFAAMVHRPSLAVATYFGDPGPGLGAVVRAGVEAVAVDLVTAPEALATIAGVPELEDRLVIAGVVDGRNVWRADLDRAHATLGTVLKSAGSVAVSTSCSLLHVPYSVASEPDAASGGAWDRLAFAAEKVGEVVVLADELARAWVTGSAEHDLAGHLIGTPASVSVPSDPSMLTRPESMNAGDARRGPAAQRAAAQARRLHLPVLPTTTIGSYPQTSDIRLARAALRSGAIDDAEYASRMRREIESVVRLQEDVGLDVLVHGEPERNDMVQYFADQLDGFLSTQNGWVQSYGTRCVRPPVLYGEVRRPAPMTLEWTSYAQSLTERPVKGMLTGPVTILAWSFVRDDQPLAETAAQVARAIREETLDLEAAGIAIIQVDEPALRELLPLRTRERSSYLAWATAAFRLATSGVADSTQIHTHLCYSEFGDAIEAIAALDADVTSIEAARSRMEVLDDLNQAGFTNQVGPGVYDIHSSRVPSQAEIESSLRAALQAVPASRLWVNPDCGLKTRNRDEVEQSLRNLVAAARTVRAS